MVFSSFPIFLDPPNWSQMQQQPHLQCLMGGAGGGGGGGGSGNDQHHHQHHQLVPPSSGQLAPLPGGPDNNPAASAPASSSSSLQLVVSGGPGQHQGDHQPARPSVSMTERARIARVPLPEPGTLRCPRCDSANTKFCYFNNYSLSQPRHFCKACRRYWTRGGALRNVPVGGGCRRNTKRSSKKSSRQGQGQGGGAVAAAATSSSSTTSTSTTATNAADILASMQALPHHLGLPAAAALEASLEGYHSHGHHQHQHQHNLSFLPQQFLQQGLHGYHFADGGDIGSQLADGFPRGVASGLLAQLASIKMEEHGGSGGGNGGGFMAGGHEQYWPGIGGGGGGGWPTEFLSGFSSSSSGNVL